MPPAKPTAPAARGELGELIRRAAEDPDTPELVRSWLLAFEPAPAAKKKPAKKRKPLAKK